MSDQLQDIPVCDSCGRNILLSFAGTLKTAAYNLLLGKFSVDYFEGSHLESFNLGYGSKQIEFLLCINCGKIQGTFPIPKLPNMKDEELNLDLSKL